MSHLTPQVLPKLNYLLEYLVSRPSLGSALALPSRYMAGVPSRGRPNPLDPFLASRDEENARRSTPLGVGVGVRVGVGIGLGLATRTPGLQTPDRPVAVRHTRLEPQASGQCPPPRVAAPAAQCGACPRQVFVLLLTLTLLTLTLLTHTRTPRLGQTPRAAACPV